MTEEYEVNATEASEAELQSETVDVSGSVTIRKTRYAVGLVWQPLQDPDNPSPEIREAMESDVDADLYCLRITSTPQYGLAKTSLGHTPGELSLAGTIASALSDKTSVCAVIKLDEGWYFLAIRNDLILSENDVLFKSEEDAQDAFFSMMAVPDWDLKIAPAEWGIEGAVTKNIETILRDARTKPRLEELGAKKRTQTLLFIGIFLILIFGAIVYSMLSVFTPAIQIEEKIEPIPIPEIVRPVEPTPEKPKPWEKIPDTKVFLNKCWNNAYQLKSLNIPGWRLGIISCNYSALTTNWSRGDSQIWRSQPRIGWVKSALKEYKLNVNLKINQDGSSANGSVAFHDIPLIASVPIYTEQQLWEELTDIKQATKLNLSFQRKSILEPPNNPDGSKPENQQEYVFFAFSITSPFTPFEWMSFFEKFPGLELTKIEFNPVSNSKDANKWKYDGRIYAK